MSLDATDENFPVVVTTHPSSYKFVTGLKIKATGDSKLNDSPTTGQIYTRDELFDTKFILGDNLSV